MRMRKEDAIKRIDRYLRRNDSHPRLVNVNNPDDFLESIRQTFFARMILKLFPTFPRLMKSLSEDALYNFLQETSAPVFLTGFTSYYRLLSEEKKLDFINRIIGLSKSDLHLVVLCYQCENYLVNSDPRAIRSMYVHESSMVPLPELVFTTPNMIVAANEIAIEGVHKIAAYIEKNSRSRLYIHTKKHKSAYPNSLYQ